MGGTHRHREGAHPSSPILILKSALQFPKEASIVGTHNHRDLLTHPLLINCSSFQIINYALLLITRHRGDPWMADSATQEMPTRSPAL